ncbi:MAG: C-terminal binding protein [Spirochaetaceae bacterium]|jgi:D-3-phosphoglycerate dehydrogenase|nr:C-terminal binding protein [Spirochaetaceae bacterium]
MLVWIIDKEWNSYELEEGLLNRELPGLEIRYSKNETCREDLEKFGKKAGGIICQISVAITGDFIAALEQCRVISVYGAGYNNVDTAAARARGITVCNVPGYCVDDVSDYVMAAIYHGNKQLEEYHRHIRNGKWGAQAVTEIINRLSVSTLFIAGYGRIGRAVAAKAKALGMEVLAYDALSKPQGVTAVSLEEGLARADFVTLHVAYTRETEHLADRDFFSRMKNSAWFINASRGGVVDEGALIEAVESKRIRGAVVDVVETEPPPPDARILHTPGILVTPHISYLSVDALRELQETAARNVADILKGRPSENIAG